MKKIKQSHISADRSSTGECTQRLTQALEYSFYSARTITQTLLFCACCVFLSLPSLAQTSGDTSPKKWPDQTECRTLLQSGQNSQNTDGSNLVTSGWCIAIDDRRGNCIACHTFNISPWPVSLPIAGNLAPPMVAMKARFPDSAALRAVIEDASKLNARSSMPPYLKHQILTAEEIDHVIVFLGTL